MKCLKKAAVIAAIVGACGLARPARADLFGGDVAVLTGILAEAINQDIQLKTQIDNLQRQVEFARQNVKQLDPTSFNSLTSFYNQSKLSYAQLKNDLQQIDYTMQGVNANFHKVFPQGKDFKNARYSDYDPLYAGWQNEIGASAYTAMRAQTTLSTLEANSQAAQQILQNSRASNGQLQQMQAVVQMLAVMQGQLNTLVQTLSTGNRVVASMAAGSANEKQAVRERKRRRTEGYTNAGKPATRLNRLP
jgi:type IV secretion system protein TrbJ